MTIEIVGFTIKYLVIFQFAMLVYQRVILHSRASTPSSGFGNDNSKHIWDDPNHVEKPSIGLSQHIFCLIIQTGFSSIVSRKSIGFEGTAWPAGHLIPTSCMLCHQLSKVMRCLKIHIAVFKVIGTPPVSHPLMDCPGPCSYCWFPWKTPHVLFYGLVDPFKPYFFKPYFKTIYPLVSSNMTGNSPNI